MPDETVSTRYADIQILPSLALMSPVVNIHNNPAANIDGVGGNGRSPLGVAAARGDVTFVRALLAAGRLLRITLTKRLALDYIAFVTGLLDAGRLFRS